MPMDRIEKRVVLRASRERVWRALTDFGEFGSWFGMRLEGPFTPGARLRGVIVPTTVDAEVAAAQKPHEGTPFEIVVDRVEPERLFSFRWHPYGVEQGVDHTAEPTTLVVFTLEEAADGILLTVTESGFESIPLERRARAFEANDQGWTMQMRNVEKYLAQAP